jgi:hypothetical protein
MFSVSFDLDIGDGLLTVGLDDVLQIAPAALWNCVRLGMYLRE